MLQKQRSSLTRDNLDALQLACKYRGTGKEKNETHGLFQILSEIIMIVHQLETTIFGAIENMLCEAGEY